MARLRMDIACQTTSIILVLNIIQTFSNENVLILKQNATNAFSTKERFYKKCFYEEVFEPNWNQIKIKPTVVNHTMSKMFKFCDQMRKEAEMYVFPKQVNLTKDAFVQAYRQFKNEKMRGMHDILYDVIKKFRVAHESALYEYYKIQDPILHGANYTAYLFKFNRIENKYILREILRLAFNLRKHVYRQFDSLDDEFLLYYFNIPCDYNMFLNYSKHYDFYQINKSTAPKRRRIWRDYDGDHSRLK